jgi:hypothetical protein
MNTRSSVVLVLFLVGSSASAQTGDQPNLVLTVFAGVSAGHSLWSITGQPFCSETSCNVSAPHDTFDLSRDVTSSLIAGAGGTFFSSSHVGIHAEIYYMGLSFEDHCRDVFASTTTRNAEICARANSSSLSSSAIVFSGGVLLRAFARRSISPYVRGGVVLATYSTGTIEMPSFFTDPATQLPQPIGIFEDRQPRRNGVGLQLGAGFTTRLGPGYQMRFELRDLVAPLDRTNGIAAENREPPKTTRLYHHIALVFGIDVVLERKRGRRY